jgi:hypothetical protein
MRRFVLLLAVLTVLAIAPASVSAASERCSIEVSPAAGGPTDVYRVTATNFPVDPAGGSLEVRIDVRRLGTREGSIFFLFLVPGTTDFYLDINQVVPGDPVEPMQEGRYLVIAETAHLAGCHTTDGFVVTA